MHDFTYVENVAHAHICAERALASDGPVAVKAAGQVILLLPILLLSNYQLVVKCIHVWAISCLFGNLIVRCGTFPFTCF